MVSERYLALAWIVKKTPADTAVVPQDTGTASRVKSGLKMMQLGVASRKKYGYMSSHSTGRILR